MDFNKKLGFWVPGQSAALVVCAADEIVASYVTCGIQGVEGGLDGRARLVVGEEGTSGVLDYCFQEDTIRKASKNAAQNFSRITRMALAVVKNSPVASGRCKTLKGKRLRTG